MMIRKIGTLGLGLVTLLMTACGPGEEEFNPEKYFAETEASFQKADSLTKAELAFVTNPEVKAFDKTWGGLVAYLGNKPAIVRLIGNDGVKWNFYLDTATQKLLYAKEEGGKTLNRMVYKADSLVKGFAVNDPIQLPAGDPRANGATLGTTVAGLIEAIRADRSDIDAQANNARREMAQFIVYGKDGSWTLTVNPGTRQVVLSEKGKEDRRFAYGSPSQNADGASIYAFNSPQGSLHTTLTTQRCEYKGRNMPYTLTIKDGSRTLTGCGLLLQ